MFIRDVGFLWGKIKIRTLVKESGRIYFSYPWSYWLAVTSIVTDIMARSISKELNVGGYPPSIHKITRYTRRWKTSQYIENREIHSIYRMNFTSLRWNLDPLGGLIPRTRCLNKTQQQRSDFLCSHSPQDDVSFAINKRGRYCGWLGIVLSSNIV
jgi:hypothetical protein